MCNLSEGENNREAYL